MAMISVMSRAPEKVVLHLVAIAVAAVIAISITCSCASIAKVVKFEIVDVKVVEPPGTSVGPATLSVRILYAGSSYLGNVKITLHLDEGDVLSENPIRAGLLSPGSVLTLTYIVNTTARKLHHVRMSVEWDREYARTPEGLYEVSEKHEVAWLESYVYVPGRPRFDISVTPRSLVRGGAQDVVVSVCNVGSDAAYSVKIHVITSLPVLNASRAYVEVPRLDASECRSLKLRVVTISPMYNQSAAFRAHVVYFDQSGSVRSEDLAVSIPTTGAAELQIVKETTYLRDSRVGEIVIRLTNVGDVDVKDVRLTVESAEGAVLLDGVLHELNVIKSGESKIIALRTLVPRGVSDRVVLTLRLSYSLPNNVSTTMMSVLSIPVVKAPDIRVIEVSYPREVTVNSTVPMSITIANLGTSAAYGVNVTIHPVLNAEPISATTVYFTRISPDETAVAAYTLRAAGHDRMIVRARVSYSDVYGMNYSAERDIVIPVVKSITRHELSETMEGKMSIDARALAVVVVCIAAACLSVYVVRARRRRPSGSR